MRKSFGKITIVISTVITLVIAEVALRVLAEPTDFGSARLFGKVLPPLEIGGISGAEAEKKETSFFVPDAPVRNLVVDDVKITQGDLWGINEPAERGGPGYWPKRNARSLNG